MHSFPSYVSVRDEDRAQFGAHMSQYTHTCFDGNWTPVDPVLYNVHFEQQKQLNPDYSYFQHTQPSYPTSLPQITEALHATCQTSGWNSGMHSYRHLRYDSPNGHFGGSISESSSDYALSPEATRHQMAFNSGRYLSPPIDAFYSQSTWTTDSSFMVTPASTPVSSQTHSVALRELEFQGAPDFQIELQEDDVRTQLPVNIPEELELSDSIATLTTSSQTNTTRSSRALEDSDSSVSTPARDNDSDSDFDPKRRTPRSSFLGKTQGARLPRRVSSSSFPIIDGNNRVHKPVSARSSINREKSRPKALPALSITPQVSTNAKVPKSFPCAFHAFGCLSTFANKNEWKRHVTSQHLQLDFYRCDLGGCNPENNSRPHVHQSHGLNQSGRGRGHNKRRSLSSSQLVYDDNIEEVIIYNDFNRKDLFTQHCRRMHGPLRHLLDNTTRTNQAINIRLRAQGRKPTTGAGRVMSTKDDDNFFEEELEDIRARCWTLRRHAPSRSSCGFCGKLFEASAHVAAHDPEGKAEERAWEERMEHLGRHYERDSCSSSLENIDLDLVEWGLNEGILVEIEGVGPWLAGYEVAKQEPQDEELRREGLRRRGPRRKISVPAVDVGARPLVRGSDVVKEEEESDEDALAEDD